MKELVKGSQGTCTTNTPLSVCVAHNQKSKAVHTLSGESIFIKRFKFG